MEGLYGSLKIRLFRVPGYPGAGAECVVAHRVM